MYAHHFVSFFGLIAIGCAAAPPPPVDPPAEPAKAAPTPKSAEWLYATDGVNGGHQAECKVVPERLEQETRCKAALCEHGVALAKDWLATCKSSTGEERSKVEQQSAELAKRASRSPAPCEAEVTDLLRDGCGERKDCREFVQSWATRCADYSTPLVLRMLEVAVERQAGEHVSIDARGCPELFDPITKAQSCDHKFKCQDILPALETYRARCEPKGKRLELAQAIAEDSLLVGAEQNVSPLDLAAGEAKLDPKVTPLPLDDGSGAVLLTCGKRTADVAGYLSARASCADTVVMARRFSTPQGAVLRVGRVPHDDDATFRRRFPSLAVQGELAARYRAELAPFEHDVDLAAKLALDSKRSEEAVRDFVAALGRHLDAVRHSRVFDTAISERDASLIPLFEAIGRAKKKVLHPDLDSKKLATALHRAQVYPLADVNVDGKVRIGQSTFASSLELEDMLPKAVAAYREALSARFERLEKLKLSSATLEKLAADVSPRVDRCADAWKRASNGEKALVACVFGEQECDDARIKSLGVELDGARRDVEAEYLGSALAISSLPSDQREATWSRAHHAGCRDP